MKKHKKTSHSTPFSANNPVAKYAHRFNKAQIYRDKSKYSRPVKHKLKESLPMILFWVIGKDSLLRQHATPTHLACLFVWLLRCNSGYIASYAPFVAP